MSKFISKAFLRINPTNIFGVIIVLHALIINKLIFFPYPEFFVYPYLANSGLIPFKEIFDQHFPGLMFLPLNFNNLGMLTPEIARVWAVFIVLIIHLLIFEITKRIANQKVAVFANFLFLIWQPFFEGWVLWIDNFLPLFLLPAFFYTYLSLEKKSSLRFVVLAGFFLSLGLLFKQVVLPLSGLTLLLLIYYRQNVKTIYYFLIGFLPIPILTTIYFWSLGALGGVWYWTIWFNLTTFARFGRKYPDLGGLIRLAWVLLPAMGLLKLKEKRLALTLGVFIIGSLAAIYARFDFVHFQPALPFVCIATSLLFFQFWRNNIIKLLLVFFVLGSTLLLLNFYRGHLGDRVLFYDERTLQTAREIDRLTTENERIFIFGASPHLYYLSNTLPTGNIFVFQFPWFVRETENLLLDSLQKDKPNIIVRDRTVVIEGNPITSFASNVDKYIEENYQTFEKIDNTELMRKK